MTDPTPTPVDALELLPSLLAESPRLRARMEQRFLDLMDAVFDQLEESLEIGTPKEKSDTMKAILPLIVRVKKDNEVGGEEVEEARAELQQALMEMGQGLGDVEELDGPVEPEGATI